MNTQNIFALIDRFLSIDNAGLEIANELERLIDDNFPDDSVIQETVEMLAMYTPEGGDYLLNNKAMRAQLTKVSDYLKSNYGDSEISKLR